MIYGAFAPGFHARRSFADSSYGQLHYREAGEGPTLVLLHNTWLSSKMFSGVMPALAKRFHVYAFDTIGQGESDPAPGKQMEIEDYARSILEAMDSVGIASAAFAGHHTGSVIASEVSIQQPDRVKRLVISGMPYWRNPVRRLANLDDSYFHGFAPDVAGSHVADAWRLHSGAGRYPIEGSSDMFADYVKPGPRTTIALQALFRWESPTKLPQISVPTLVACHDSDGFVKNVDHIHALIPGSTLAILPGGDAHPLHGEESFTRAVVDFCS